jgi:SAM-dependent methyltransferase
MQINSGLRSVLALPLVYRLAMWAVGGHNFRHWFIDNILALKPGQKVVDIGCGPADILNELGTVDYIGLDTSEAYVDAARRRYGERGAFISGNVESWAADPRIQDADLVLCYGVLHHVDDDEAKKIVQMARQCLKSGGRFVFFEPSYLLWQSRWSVFMMSRDRGQSIRTEQGWKALVSDVFPRTVTNIVSNFNRIGYTNVIGQCIVDDSCSNGRGS